MVKLMSYQFSSTFVLCSLLPQRLILLVESAHGTIGAQRPLAATCVTHLLRVFLTIKCSFRMFFFFSPRPTPVLIVLWCF